MVCDDICQINFPSESSLSVFDSRLGALYFPSISSVICVDLKHALDQDKARIVSEFCVRGVHAMALSRLLLAFANMEGIRVVDPSSPGRTSPVIEALAPVTAMDWSPSRILAIGNRQGSLQLWDCRAPDIVLSSSSSYSQIPLKISLLKWNRLFETSLVSVQGDAVCVWDCRSLRNPVSKLTAPLWKSNVMWIDWLGSSDLILSTKNEGLLRFSDLTVDFLEKFNQDVFCSIPRDSGTCQVAQESKPGLIELTDPFSRSVIDSFETGIAAACIGYLEDSRSVVISNKNSLVVKSVANHASGWSVKDASLLQSESSPRLHPVPSHITSSDQFLSDEMRTVHAALNFAARRLRRCFIEAALESNADVCELDLTLAGSDRAPTLKLTLRAEDCGNADLPSFNWEVWWIAEDRPDLPDPSSVHSQFLCGLDLRSLGDNGEVDTLIATIKKMKDFVSSQSDSVADESLEENASDKLIPFPPTCGICWSPSGDLLRFNSVRNLGPYPQNREKASMHAFMQMHAKISSHGTSSSVSLALNDFWEFREPESTNVDDDKLDEEFNQRIFTDACVKTLPATVFESLVEDHWFASMAPCVDLSRPPIECCLKIAEMSRQFKSPGPILVHDTICLLIELLSSSFCQDRSVLETIKQTILLDRLRLLYNKEQTQAVAVIASLLLLNGENIWESDSEFFRSILLLIHDHCVLFQRLGCFSTSRFLEKIQRTYSPDLPLLSEPGLVGCAQASCSVCCLPVHGLGLYCPDCGHGGHLNHVSKWTKCPLCGCRCWHKRQPPPVASTFITSS